MQRKAVDGSLSHIFPDARAARVNYSRQRAYLLSVFPFLLVFLLQEVTDDLKEILPG